MARTDSPEGAAPSVMPPASPSEAREVLVSAHGLSKGYPRPRKAGGLTGWFHSRLMSAEAVPDDDDELEDEDEEREDGERAAGWVVRDVDLELLAGSSTGIAGPASSGKTTLVELLAGLAPPTAGRIVASGRVVPVLDNMPKLMQDNDVRRNVVLLARVLGLSRSWAMQQRAAIIAFAGLTGSERRLRSQLAIGELQRLAISTMLHVDGIAYAVDSTLGGRDREFRERCLEKLEERRRAGAAIVHTARELEGVERLCDEVLWLESGRIVARGTSEAVAEAVAQRRAGKRDEGAPTSVPTPKAALFVRFLRVAIGDLRTNEALHTAEETARSAGEDRVDWPDIAANAGYDASEAQRIVDRLSRSSDDLFEDEQPAPPAP